jgi:hypothetical protein
MQSNTSAEDDILEEFVQSSLSMAGQVQQHPVEQPSFVISNFDEPIPDVLFNPFPSNLTSEKNAFYRDDDAFSEYSAISGNVVFSPGSLLANGDLLSNIGGNISDKSAASAPNNKASHGAAPPALLINNGTAPSFLTVPTAQSFSRNRSPSISSNTSYSSMNLDGLELGDNYGETSIFPGARVVQVPSPWIRAINSPTQSIISDLSPLDTPEPLD